MHDQFENKRNIHLDSTSAVSALESLLLIAAFNKASDIHVDPKENHMLVRVRIDGTMEDIGFLPLHIHEELISRIKILSGMRTDLHTVPQDGRWRALVDGQEYNIRVSIMPTYYGENAVLRILPAKGFDDLSFAKLGFSHEHTETIRRALKSPHGLILVTGPTGSGKTTTMHACLASKSQEPISIITLEDPVEYEIPNVRQVHIYEAQGVTFARGLRSALRQDPDVIMVGEIRDAETARVAVHTALTGHLVISTLHTNSALETIPRLIDMGVDRYLVASTLHLIIAERLVRTICRECAMMGCDKCRRSGYSGRSVIAEVCEIDSTARSIIGEGRPLNVLSDYIFARGFRTIYEDGLEKVQWGVTSREEVVRVLDCE